MMKNPIARNESHNFSFLFEILFAGKNLFLKKKRLKINLYLNFILFIFAIISGFDLIREIYNFRDAILPILRKMCYIIVFIK